MTPLELKDELIKIVENKILDSVLIMGESGVGKTAVIKAVGTQFDLPVHVVQWGQLAPTDARGVPVPNHELKVTEFYPPTFWPKKGPAIVFLDEYNMAATTMMALGQQVILEKRFGDYEFPPETFVWAAGNRKTDLAAVNTIPGPMQNRVAHYTVLHDLWAWKVWAYQYGIDTRIIGFLESRSELLHKPSHGDDMAWPSPRTWEMADRRLKAKMSVAPVIGQDVSDEFEAHLLLRAHIPNVDLIEKGGGQNIAFPEEPSLKYALIAEMTHRSLQSWGQFTNCARWAIAKAAKEPDWVAAMVQDTVRLLAVNDPRKRREYLGNLMNFPDIRKFASGQAAEGGLI
jgi:hypothetical protein